MLNIGEQHQRQLKDLDDQHGEIRIMVYAIVDTMVNSLRVLGEYPQVFTLTNLTDLTKVDVNFSPHNRKYSREYSKLNNKKQFTLYLLEISELGAS